MKFKKLTELVLILLLLASTAFGQNKPEKQFIDSIVSGNEKIEFVKKSYVGDSLKATYYINPKSEGVMKIEVETLDKFRNKWVYWYYLGSNQRPLIVSAERIDEKVFRQAIYYFKDDKLVYKKETNVKLDEPEKQSKSVRYLLDRMPN
jgi:hypothetical protein